MNGPGRRSRLSMSFRSRFAPLQELARLGLLYDTSVVDETPALIDDAQDNVLPCFRSRSRPAARKRVQFVVEEGKPDVVEDDHNDEWDLISLATSESASEAWEILGHDS